MHTGIQVGTVSGLPMTGIVEMGLPIAGGQSTVHAQLDPMVSVVSQLPNPKNLSLCMRYERKPFCNSLCIASGEGFCTVILCLSLFQGYLGMCG